MDGAFEVEEAVAIDLPAAAQDVFGQLSGIGVSAVRRGLHGEQGILSVLPGECGGFGISVLRTSWFTRCLTPFSTSHKDNSLGLRIERFFVNSDCRIARLCYGWVMLCSPAALPLLVLFFCYHGTIEPFVLHNDSERS